MIRLAFKRMIHRKTNTIFTLIAMISMLTIIPLGIHFSQETTISVQETIEQYGRGTYDILVRPMNSRTPMEKELGVVEENYIGDSSGGISIKEWEEIKAHQDIDIAAPVASLGYFTGNRTSIELPALDYPAKITFDFFTSDGVNHYPIPEEFMRAYPSYYYEEDRLEENIVYYFGELPSQPDYYANTSAMTGMMAIRYPSSYYLLTAIDIESEERLTGIDYSDLERELDVAESLDLELFLEYRDNPPVIPILQRDELNIPLYLSLTVEEMEVDIAEYKERYEVPFDSPMFVIEEGKEQQFRKEIEQLPTQSAKQYEIDLSKDQHPFNSTHLIINNEFQTERKPGGSLMNDTSIYFTASKIDYSLHDETIFVKKTADQEPPLYKEIEQHGQSYMEEMSAPFMLWQMGTFSSPTDENKLVSSPLGMYSTVDVMTTDGKIMTPTITPGSFIAQPAAGVTTLEAAEFIKGEKPIDAIRLQVAGINAYTEEAQQKIERVATELMEIGYEVDIVAGSSFKQLPMDVEGVGLVHAPWTTLGVAQGLTSSWNIFSLTSALLFALFGVTWFSSRLLYERNALAPENDVLLLLGWRKRTIQYRNITEQLLLVTSAFLFSIMTLVLFPYEMNKIVYLSTIFIYLFSVAMIWVLLRNQTKQSKRTIGYKKNVHFLHFRHLIQPIMLVLITSFTLIAIQVASIVLTISEANVTTLGAFTNEVIIYLQLIILIITIGLVILSVSEAMTAILNERKTEFHMYHIIGWTRPMIRRHFSKEVFIWSGASVVGGIVPSSIILVNLGMNSNWVLVGLFCASICIIVPLVIIVRIQHYGKQHHN